MIPSHLHISPKHFFFFFFGSLWITCAHPCLNCSNMLGVDQTERLSERAARQSFPCGLLGIRHEKQKKNKGLSGLLKTPGPRWNIKIHLVKQAWNTRWLRELLKHVKTPLLSLRNVVSEQGETFKWDTQPLLDLLFVCFKDEVINTKPESRVLSMNTSHTFSHKCLLSWFPVFGVNNWFALFLTRTHNMLQQHKLHFFQPLVT